MCVLLYFPNNSYGDADDEFDYAHVLFKSLCCCLIHMCMCVCVLQETHHCCNAAMFLALFHFDPVHVCGCCVTFERCMNNTSALYICYKGASHHRADKACTARRFQQQFALARATKTHTKTSKGDLICAPLPPPLFFSYSALPLPPPHPFPPYKSQTLPMLIMHAHCILSIHLIHIHNVYTHTVPLVPLAPHRMPPLPIPLACPPSTHPPHPLLCHALWSTIIAHLGAGLRHSQKPTYRGGAPLLTFVCDISEVHVVTHLLWDTGLCLPVFHHFLHLGHLWCM